MTTKIHNGSRMEGDHNHHGGSDVCGGMGMRMTYHGGYCETLLFDQWKIASVAGLVGSCIAVFLMAALFETIKQYREYLWSHEQVPEATSITKKIFRRSHFYQTLLHGIQFALAYSIMLIIMSFNYWLTIGILLGGLSGYAVGKVRWPRARQEGQDAAFDPQIK